MATPPFFLKVFLNHSFLKSLQSTSSLPVAPDLLCLDISRDPCGYSFLTHHFLSMPRPRLGLKSRTGCRQCKRRRVKCDERSPICGDCSRLQLDCSFVSITPHLWSMKPLRRGQGDERWGAPTQRPGPVPQGILSSQRLHSLQASLSEEPPQYTLEDMRLLYHFSNHTAMTLSDVPEAQLAYT